MISLRRRTFERWLNQQPDHATIGYPRSGARCPIAEYIQDQGGEDVSIDGNSYSYWHGGLPYEPRTPEWAKMFISEVDKLPNAFVTKQEALDALP